MGILAGFMVPHPPMIVPEVGRGSESQIEETTRAYEYVADRIAELQPETIILSSPHSIMYADYFHISPGRYAEGSFARFGAPKVAFHVEYDKELVGAISNRAYEHDLQAGVLGEKDAALDHGTMVPLYFITKKYKDFRLVRIGLSGFPLDIHYQLGQQIKEAVNDLGRRAVYVASGDLSHKLQEYGPYGFAPDGPVYDARIMDVMGRGAFDELLDFDEGFLDRAAECGHRSFVMMAGALDQTEVEIQKLSHQDVTGVGYGICSYIVKKNTLKNNDEKDVEEKSENRNAGTEKPSADETLKEIIEDGKTGNRAFLTIWQERQKEKLMERKAKEDIYVRLARASIESYIRGGKALDFESVRESLIQVGGADAVFEMMHTQAGAFVSLHMDGRLRGCIGTIQATRDSVAEEIMTNAISAALHDNRFEPVREDELDRLEYSVDILGPREKIDSPDQLDVKRYGVIVTKGYKRGLLLPNLDSVDTIEEQIAIAKQKAGIPVEETNVQLERFEVVRHY